MKRVLPLLLAAALLSATILAAPGDADDPVISRSYLTEVYQPALTGQLHATANASLTQVYATNFLALAESVAARNQAQAMENTGVQRNDGSLLLKKGDVLTLLPGTRVTLLSGTCRSVGAHLIDVTHGWRVTDDAKLLTRALYMKDESETGGLTVVSDTATLTITGPYALRASSAVDYASRAEALKDMTLFLGSNTGGFSLENTATRIHGLVVFLRIMGLEEEALSFTGTHPFTDVPETHWAYSYVAYAYQNGYTKGATETTFAPSRPISAKNYIAFMMRALNYDEGAQFQYATILSDCVRLGLFTQTEIDTLTNGTFTRGRMVYLSYYSLFGTDQQTGSMLLDSLVQRGVVSQSTADRAICRVIGARMR